MTWMQNIRLGLKVEYFIYYKHSNSTFFFFLVKDTPTLLSKVAQNDLTLRQKVSDIRMKLTMPNVNQVGYNQPPASKIQKVL